MVASPVMRRICAAISLRNAAFEKAQGAAAAAIATRMARPAKIWIISDRSLRDGGEELETTVADSTMALRLPLMGLRKAKASSREGDAGSVRIKEPGFCHVPPEA
jgi:hypothetical protein